jgi:phosphate-selective porin OprO/OprP
VLLWCAGRLHAQTGTALPGFALSTQPGSSAEVPPSPYDRIWRFAEWYGDDSNPVVQRVLFTGRYQHEFTALDADQGDLTEWNIRRMRLGSRVTLFRSFTFHGEVDLNPQEADPLYVRLTDMYVQWTRSAQLSLTAGKHGAPFTLDGATSSKELLTVDRSNLANNIWFPQEYMPGVSVSGRRAPWTYSGAVYSSGEANREFGEFTGSVFALGVLGYDFAKPLGAKQAVLTGNYVYQHPDPKNTFTRQLEHVVSVNFRYEVDRWGVRSDLAAAKGYLGQSDIWGLTAMPFISATSRLQFVVRYTFLESSDPSGLRLATYENSVVAHHGDEYNELYVGANYYFYGHKLKIQSGVVFADMNDSTGAAGAYTGASWTTGLRIGW